MAISERQLVVLEAMGIPVWRSRRASITESSDTSGQEWQRLEQEALACTKCELHKCRTQVVFGVGNRQARWLVIGEAPGAEEDRQGEPFVGRAGQLLNEMLQAVGLSRQQVYIANILKCRPPENRDPKPEEAATCEQYLQRQIALIQPRLILTVGRIAAQNLLRDVTPIGKLRGRVHRYGPDGIPVVVTYHPAYLLRSPGQKRKSWEDLCLAMATVDPRGNSGGNAVGGDVLQ
ncbi:MAG: uracil-DNA glycosylase [Gammaproteobacteria bacterium]